MVGRFLSMGRSSDSSYNALFQFQSTERAIVVDSIYDSFMVALKEKNASLVSALPDGMILSAEGATAKVVRLVEDAVAKVRLCLPFPRAFKGQLSDSRARFAQGATALAISNGGLASSTVAPVILVDVNSSVNYSLPFLLRGCSLY